MTSGNAAGDALLVRDVTKDRSPVPWALATQTRSSGASKGSGSRSNGLMTL